MSRVERAWRRSTTPTRLNGASATTSFKKNADAKRADMLMVVTGRSKAGIYRTRYAFPAELPRSWRRKVWRNSLAALHDPRRFAIELPGRPVSASGPAPAPGRAATTATAPDPIATS